MTALERLKTGADALTTSVKALAAIQTQAGEKADEIAIQEADLARTRADAALVTQNVEQAKAAVGGRIDEAITTLTEMKAELTA